jgi:hypothetical protein
VHTRNPTEVYRIVTDRALPKREQYVATIKISMVFRDV